MLVLWLTLVQLDCGARSKSTYSSSGCFLREWCGSGKPQSHYPASPQALWCPLAPLHSPVTGEWPGWGCSSFRWLVESLPSMHKVLYPHGHLHTSHLWECVPTIAALETWRQQGQKFSIVLSYRANLEVVWATWDLISKQINWQKVDYSHGFLCTKWCQFTYCRSLKNIHLLTLQNLWLVHPPRKRQLWNMNKLQILKWGSITEGALAYKHKDAYRRKVEESEVHMCRKHWSRD